MSNAAEAERAPIVTLKREPKIGRLISQNQKTELIVLIAMEMLSVPQKARSSHQRNKRGDEIYEFKEKSN
jgi:hypothetical protein